LSSIRIIQNWTSRYQLSYKHNEYKPKSDPNKPVKTEGKIQHVTENPAPTPTSDTLYPNPMFSDEALARDQTEQARRQKIHENMLMYSIENFPKLSNFKAVGT